MKRGILMKNVLTIAGSDSCGGAGIQADIKTFSALGTYGMSVITAVTAQNTKGVIKICEMEPEIVESQINCLFDDITIHAVKIGMVSSIGIIDTIGRCLKDNGARNIILDPVMVSKSGYHLLKPEAIDELIKVLFPMAALVTPNLFEAEVITGRRIENIEQMKDAAKMITTLGAKSVVVKGGHLEGDAVDVFFDGVTFSHLKSGRIHTKNTHGTGCTFSSAVTAFIARNYPMPEALQMAKEYISIAIEHSIELGAGPGPTNHFYSLYKAAGLNYE
jgi:hydroxymethylpyrimidine/phosphomethylpyrimidine kinase